MLSQRCPLWQLANFKDFSGISIPSLGCAITVGHALLGPVAVEPFDLRKNVYPSVTYAVLPLPTDRFRYGMVPHSYLRGGSDLAILCQEEPVDGGKALLSKIQRTLPCQVLADFRKQKRKRIEIASSDGPPCEGLFCVDKCPVTGFEQLVVRDVGFPGLSGSPAYDPETGKLIGIYTARIPASRSSSARDVKLQDVIAYCRRKLHLPPLKKPKVLLPPPHARPDEVLPPRELPTVNSRKSLDLLTMISQQLRELQKEMQAQRQEIRSLRQEFWELRRETEAIHEAVRESRTYSIAELWFYHSTASCKKSHGRFSCSHLLPQPSSRVQTYRLYMHLTRTLADVRQPKLSLAVRWSSLESYGGSAAPNWSPD